MCQTASRIHSFKIRHFKLHIDIFLVSMRQVATKLVTPIAPIVTPIAPIVINSY